MFFRVDWIPSANPGVTSLDAKVDFGPGGTDMKCIDGRGTLEKSVEDAGYLTTPRGFCCSSSGVQITAKDECPKTFE